ncbi:MAG: heme-binding protein [Spirochaetota bacterium]|nr:MAG: heme-binding protein [Spirochaetota bacterium]
MALFIIFIIIVLLIVVWSVGIFLYEKHLERPSYEVIEKHNGYEVRMYDPYIIAETEVTGGYESASNKGFGILAGYIFGNNTRKEKVAMTAPVAMEKKQTGEKISMTVPVIMQPKGAEQNEKYIMSFMMPSKYTLDNLPKPNDPAVKLHRVSEKKVAALRFSMLAKADRVEKKTKQLREALKRDGFTAFSEPEIARYNAPFSNPLLRRNEILIKIE